MITLLAFQAFYAAYLLWVWQGFTRLKKRKYPIDSTGHRPFVSVVVPYRNERPVLSGLLASLGRQDYPAECVEWILVNDHSEDDGPALVQEWSDSRLRALSLPAGLQGKKSAIQFGVDTASGEWILTTDADCTHTVDWISCMTGAGERSQAAMVCGRVRVMQDGSLLTLMQDMETCFLQTAGAGSLANGVPLLNTGASLLFRRDAFLQTGGHRKNIHIASGDDTFLMLDFHRKYPGKVIPVSSPSGTAMTRPQPTWKAWISQRTRWQSKVVHYPPGLVHLTGMLILVSGISMCGLWVMIVATGLQWKVLLIALFIRMIPEFLILHSGQQGRGTFPLLFVMFTSAIAPFFQLLSGFSTLFIPRLWKGRRI